MGNLTASAALTLEVTIDRFFFSNAESGYGVARAIEKGTKKQITLAGPLVQFRPRQNVTVTGEWTSHPKFGDQFKVAEAVGVRPSTTDGIIQYLADIEIEGVGRGKAKRIVDLFGEKTLDVIEREPDRLREVAGLKAEEIEALHKHLSEDKAAAEFAAYMRKLGVGPRNARRIYDRFGVGAHSVIQANPYVLADEVDGIGFVMSDQIATSIGFSPASPFRCRAAINFALKEAASGSGHCGLPASDLEEKAAELIRQPSQLLRDAIGAMLEAGQVVLDRDLIYSPALFQAECESAAKVRALMEIKPSFDKERIRAALDQDEHQRTVEMVAKGQSGEFRYNEAQKDAVLRLAETNVLIVTGGPGTGKTTIVKAILAVFRNYGLEVNLASPTGRAAQRMEEATGCPAQTVHRLLRYNPMEGGFQINGNPESLTGAVIVDEVSMLDIELLTHLLRAIQPGTPLVLVGDINQLPSVGPGTVLRDLIQANVPTQFLKVIMRQAAGSWIISNSHRINGGEMPRVPEGDEARTADFHFVEREDAKDVAAEVVKLATERLPRLKGYGDRDAIVSKIQVLAPQRRGDCGVTALNTALQAALNPPNEGEGFLFAGEDKLRVGDKVMQTANSYDLGVFNGEVGLVRSLNLKDRTLDVAYERCGTTVVITYTSKQAEKLSLAYAVTVHKSQGSEYPVVVIPLHTQHWMMLQRNLFYTGVTRAKQLVVVVGTRKAMERAVANNEIAARYSRLRERVEA